ncbi:stereocilin [Salvelinus alpinus]|uniref:stereocilin n=1 Tax=Salvelinus alpinus TaxID=8036 RepID=UPI0039FC4531
MLLRMQIFFALSILGMVCDAARPVRSLSRAVSRKGPADASKFDRNIEELIERIHDLSNENHNVDANARAGISADEILEDPNVRTGGTVLEGIDLSAYYGVLGKVFAMYRPLIEDGFIENLPKTFVCILSGRMDCGLEAELTKTVSLELGKPLLSLLSSFKSQTCTRSSTSSEPSLFQRSYLRVDDSTVEQFSAFQEIMTALSRLSLSDKVMSAWTGLIDMTFPAIVTHGSEFILTFLQTPMDYVKIALQFGIAMPALDQNEQCQQGDLKQLLMWGIRHNVSWSFGDSILDMFLAPESTLCSYPGPDCQSLPTVSFSRTLKAVEDNPTALLRCDHDNLARFNDTLCADIITVGLQSSSTLSTFCNALSILNPTEVEQVWSNTCRVIQALLLPVLEDRSDCSGDIPAPPPPGPRVSRSLSLSQLLCNYGNWTNASDVDAGLVTLCSENDRQEFILAVCSNIQLMQALMNNNPNNSWLWNFCVNSSDGYMVSQFCRYQTWTAETVDPTMVAVCWDQDKERLMILLCQNLDLFTVVFSHVDNNWLQLNCTEAPTQPDINSLVAASCQYSEWQNVMEITIEMISMCIQNDDKGFVLEVCANATFLNELLHNSATVWVGEYCTVSLNSPPTNLPVVFSIPDWCNYDKWSKVLVDPSMVELCWRHDQMGFNKNVCCNMPLFEKLTLEPQNEWLMSVCVDKETKDILPQVCRYSDWNKPIIVDMTDLALCAELDSLNFTQKVCTNTTVLQNLLANPDNTWLLAYCANHTGPGGGGGQGGGLMGFKPVEQCQYHSWAAALPDTSLLNLCWDYDQANFVSSICTNTGLLSLLTKEPYSLWVGTLCTTYTNYTKGNSQGKTNSTSTDSQPCLVRDIVRRLNWTCSADFSPACQPGSSQTQALQLLLRCGVKVLQHRLEGLLTTHMASVVDQATSVTVVLLVALEESQMMSLRVTENIRFNVLKSVVLYLEKETNFDNKRVLLQCFGKVLTSLMQTGRHGNSDGFFLIKEYFRIPLANLRAVLSAVDITTVRQILQYFSRNQGTLQFTDDYLGTMVSVLFQTHLVRDGSLFPELVPLLALVNPADIQSLPPLQTNLIVRNTINSNIRSLSVEQRRAFGRWYSRALSSLNMTAGGPSFIRDTGNLIVYLPFQSFQHLSPAQLLAGMDVLLMNTLSHLQQQFVAESLIRTFRNLTVEQFRRLGNLTCLSDPKDLQVYRNTEAFSVIQDNIRACVAQGLRGPSDMISSLFLNGSELQSPGSLSAGRVLQLASFLPWLGVDFLQKLSQSQLSPALTALASVPFTPAQASVIVDKVSLNNSLALPGQLQKLGSLVSGVKVETLWNLPSDILLSSLPDIALHTPGLNPSQANTITTKLWDSPEVTGWLDKVEPLLPSTPLLSVLTRASLLLTNRTLAGRQAWNTQQAKTLFKEAVKTMPNLSTETFLALGSIARGVSCTALRQLFRDKPTFSSMRSVLAFMNKQSVPLHSSLKKCIIEELYYFDFFSELLGEFGAQIALALPVSTIKKFPADMMDTLRKIIVKDSHHFLLLPSTKQDILVDKMVQRLGMYTGEFTEDEFRSLGIMATYVVDEVFVQLVRSFFVESLEFLREFCYNSSKRDIVAQILQEPGTFGPVQNWTPETLNQVDRFLFFLPKETLQQIPQALMTPGRIERLFLSQRRWESGAVGALCIQGRDQVEQTQLFERQQFVLQNFLGFLKVGQVTPPALMPTCEKLHATQPSAWSTDSLTGMSSATFSCSLELFGQDPFFSSYQQKLLLQKTKEIYGAARSFSSSVITQLGRIASQLSVAELSVIRLSELSTISALGAVSTWNSRQLAVLSSSVLNSTQVGPSQLDSSTLVAMGHILCGIKDSDMRSLNAVEFSKAVLWLGRLRLSCSEEQQQALTGLLSHSLAFGPISSWGPEVFIEVGALSAGLPDMAMSSLVKEQIEGLTPLAVSLIRADKFAVVFDPAQISMFSYEQAKAVTEAQRLLLSPVQLTAMSMVLTVWDDKPVDFRGRSPGLALCPSPLCHLLGLLMVLLVSAL